MLAVLLLLEGETSCGYAWSSVEEAQCRTFTTVCYVLYPSCDI